MLRDLGEGIHSEVECTRTKAWAEATLPEIHVRLVNSLRRLNLEERPLLADAPAPDQNVFYTRRERTWNAVRMVIPECQFPLMEVTMLGFTSTCGLKICFDRWLQHSCHESHFAVVLEPRREHRVMLIADKSVNSPFIKDLLEIDDIVEVLSGRFFASLSMCGLAAARPAEKTRDSPALVRR